VDWNLFVVAKRPGEVCYLAALSHDVVFRHGLPLQAIVGEALASAGEVMSHGVGGVDYDHFKPNPEFTRFLHRVLAKHARQCPGVVLEARRQRTGHLYILDKRTPTPLGTVPPADIIGAVEVQNGAAIGYQGSPQYEPFGRNGLMQLDSWLEARFTEELLALAGSLPH
jgi:hypothetical protein